MKRNFQKIFASATAGLLIVAGAGCATTETTALESEWSANTLAIDWATYNPLSLVIKEQGILE